MIDNDTLLAFALNGLEPDEQARLRGTLERDTAALAKLDRIHSILKPLEADREPPAPPPGLAEATLAGFERTMARPKSFAPPIRRWVELAVAAGIGMVGFGLVAGAVSIARHDSGIRSCANNLRMISTGLHSYADTNNDRFPQVPEANEAASFRKEMATSGHWPQDARFSCDSALTTPVGYTYSLGYRGANGTLVGPSRIAGQCGPMPIVSDFPAGEVRKNGPTSPHRRGHNVLFADGRVEYLKTPLLQADNIFLNDAGLPRAGLHAGDAVLGNPFDTP